VPNWKKPYRKVTANCDEQANALTRVLSMPNAFANANASALDLTEANAEGPFARRTRNFPSGV
jgi:hypothetical protein